MCSVYDMYLNTILTKGSVSLCKSRIIETEIDGTSVPPVAFATPSVSVEPLQLVAVPGTSKLSDALPSIMEEIENKW